MKRSATDTEREKLPFRSTLLKAYTSILNNSGTAARVLLPPLVAYCAISATLSYWQFSFTNGNSFMSAPDVLYGLADEVAAVTLITPAAVSWHRLVLLGEVPPLLPLSAHRLLRSYLLLALAISSTATVPLYAGMYGWQLWTDAATIVSQQANLPAPDGPQVTEHAGENVSGAARSESQFIAAVTLAAWAAGTISILLAILAALSFLAMRLSLVLPAIATGAEDRSLLRAWTLSRGNFWRLYWGSVLTMLPATAAAALSMALIDTTTHTGFVLDATILAGMLFACTLIWVAFLSHAYRAFTEGARDSLG